MNELGIHRALTVLLTAALLATLTGALTGGQRAEAVDGPVEVVYVATGRNFPDALAGANLAATVGAPLLTVEPDLPIPDTTLTALQSLDPDRIIVLGGPAAVSDAVADALLPHARSGSVTRIQGTDRHDTAARIADALPDTVHDADLLDGLDSSAFVRVEPPMTRYVMCGPRDMAEYDAEDAALVAGNGLHYVRASSGGSSTVALGCDLQVPEGATIRALGVDGHDDNPGGQLGCTAMGVWNRDGPAPVQIGTVTTPPTSVDSADDERLRVTLDEGAVVAGEQTHATIVCVLSEGANLRAYAMFVEYDATR